MTPQLRVGQAQILIRTSLDSIDSSVCVNSDPVLSRFQPNPLTPTATDVGFRNGLARRLKKLIGRPLFDQSSHPVDDP